MTKPAVEILETSTPQLAEDEVARILSALQSAEFKPSNKHQLKKVKDFQKRSLLEIASAAQQAKFGDKVEVPDKLQAFQDAQVNQVGDEGSSKLSASGFSDKETSEALGKDIASTNLFTENSISFSGTSFTDEGDDAPKSVEQSAEDSSSDTGISFSGTSFTDEGDDAPKSAEQSAEDSSVDTGISFSGTSFTDEGDDDPRSGEQRVDATSPETKISFTSHSFSDDDKTETQSGNRPPSAKSFDTFESAYDRGKLDGIEQGKAIARAEMIEKSKNQIDESVSSGLKELLEVVKKARQPELIDLESLETSLRLAVMRLASERAGYAIDECGDYFIERIKSLVDQVEMNLSEAKLLLNPDDLRALVPFVQQLESEQLDLVADERMARGDVVLKFGGIELSDRADERINQNVSAGIKTDAVPNLLSTAPSTVSASKITITDNDPIAEQSDSTKQNSDDFEIEISSEIEDESESTEIHENFGTKPDDDRFDP